MLKRLVALSIVGVAATAAHADMATLDTNADGVVSFEEMLAAVPSVTEETFTTLDINADGIIDAEEYAAAEAAGTLPATDG